MINWKQTSLVTILYIYVLCNSLFRFRFRVYDDAMSLDFVMSLDYEFVAEQSLCVTIDLLCNISLTGIARLPGAPCSRRRNRRSLILGDREVVAYDRGICYFSPPIRTSSVGVFLKCIGLNLNAGFRQLVWSLLGMFGGVRQSSGFVLLGQYITGAWGSTVSSGILLFCMG